MVVLEKIDSDFKQALKKRDRETISVLSILRSALKNEEIKKRRENLSEDDVLGVLRRELKQRKESQEEWHKAGRMEKKEEEQRAIELIESYLPLPMAREEIEKIAADVIKELKAASPADTGKVMGILMPRLEGRADGALASKIVGDLLSANKE